VRQWNLGNAGLEAEQRLDLPPLDAAELKHRFGQILGPFTGSDLLGYHL
jgi:hypothetical protein